MLERLHGIARSRRLENGQALHSAASAVLGESQGWSPKLRSPQRQPQGTALSPSAQGDQGQPWQGSRSRVRSGLGASGGEGDSVQEPSLVGWPGPARRDARLCLLLRPDCKVLIFPAFPSSSPSMSQA